MTDAVYNSLEFKDQIDWMVSFIPQPKIQQSYAAASGGNSLGLGDIEDDQMGKLTAYIPRIFFLTVSQSFG